MDFDWGQPGAEDRLKELYRAGNSAGTIALILPKEFHGYPTRNAIIGKLHRLGLMGRPTVSAAPRKKRHTAIAVHAVNKARVDAKATEPEPTPVVEPEDILPEGQGCTLLQLDNKTCRWPYGEPDAATFKYCGKREADLTIGEPYYKGHRRKAGNPNARLMSDEERRRRAIAYRRRMSSQHQEA